jgi:hypothetical protein
MCSALLAQRSTLGQFRNGLAHQIDGSVKITLVTAGSNAYVSPMRNGDVPRTGLALLILNHSTTHLSLF